VKTLLLLRHAKSDQGPEYPDDHARPLAKRGQKDARRMGRFLAVAGLLPDVAVSSTAERALDTLTRAMEAGGWTDVPAHATDALYEATAEAVLDVVRALGADAETALLVGHEPTFSHVVSRLVGGGAVEMATGALARVELDVEGWAEVEFGRGALAWLVPPKALRDLPLKKALAGPPAEANAAADAAADAAGDGPAAGSAPAADPAGGAPASNVVPS
jgi:phosphohistidine phosphatase